MVIVVVGGPGSGAVTIARVLAIELGWPHLEGNALRATVARAVDRRERAVISCPALPHSERETLHADLRAVRFVDLEAAPPPAGDTLSITLAIGPRPPADEAIRRIRREFGV